jgi:hypothetical protein
MEDGWRWLRIMLKEDGDWGFDRGIKSRIEDLGSKGWEEVSLM